MRWSTTRAATIAAIGVAVLTLSTACTSSGGQGTSTAPTGKTPTSTPGSSSVSAPTSPASNTGSGTASSPAGPGPKAVHQKLTNFRILDVTFVGSQAWALGSADCLSGKGSCDAIEYSGDGGRTWRSAPAPRANVQGTARPNCADPCIAHIRFATPSVGYAFGSPSQATSGTGALFMTSDGGTHWTREPGSADALETLDGTVIRVNDTGGCPPGCRYTVQTAGVGSTHWRSVALPGPGGLGASVGLARTGSHAYLLDTGNPAGGGNSERSVLWSSVDGGAHWTNRGEPCPQSGSIETDSSRISSAPDGTVAVLCSERGGSRRTFVAVSTNAARSFQVHSRTALGAAPVDALAVGSSSVVLVSSDETYRSTDAGARFARLSANAGSSPDQPGSVGFASASVVHAFTTDQDTLYTSIDAGRTWTAHRF